MPEIWLRKCLKDLQGHKIVPTFFASKKLRKNKWSDLGIKPAISLQLLKHIRF